MKGNLPLIFNNKTTLILVTIIILLIASGFLAYQKFIVSKNQIVGAIEEVDLTFDPEGPYALLIPRRDGNAMNVNIKRTSSYDAISYELAYTSEGIDRGVMGDIKTDEKKGEYNQEVLFGTCSKNVCKYDKEVENGTLILHIKKAGQDVRMITQWHLQKPDVALGTLTSGDNHLTYKLDQKADLALVKYSIINDLTGAPKLDDGKTVVGKVYSANTPVAKDLPAGTITIDLADNPPAGSKINRFDETKSSWVEYDTKVTGSTLTALVDKGGVFAVLAPKPN